jgi:Fic family protein
LLTDLSVDLPRERPVRGASRPGSALADLVRAMNCYYSNLIEGHDTHPIDIERALKNDYSQDQKKRNLQLEAKAHISVQRWIDSGALDREATTEAACEMHKRFSELLPDELLWAENKETGEIFRVEPGRLRERDVKIGRYVPVSPGAVPRFMRRFEEVFAGLGKAEAILASAAMHHRFLWIHPFVDGNGRVARLASHALLRLLDTGMPPLPAAWHAAQPA